MFIRLRKNPVGVAMTNAQLEPILDNLQESTVQFQRNAAAVRRKLWWKNIKLNFVLLLAFLTLLIVVVRKGSCSWTLI